MNGETYQNYLAILREELVPALGCTEPVSIAYAAAKARAILGEMPARVRIRLSGNIIKNVKGVKVPQSSGLKGIEAAVLLGLVGGDANKGLEVLAGVTPAHEAEVRALLAEQDKRCIVELLRTPAKLHILLTAESDAHTALVEILHQHTAIVRLERDGEVLFTAPVDPADCDCLATERDKLNVADILAFADGVLLADVEDMIDRQIELNAHIAEEGLKKPYGNKVGANLVKYYGSDVRTFARAATAAGSDARMSGCELPVVINSGSGNQGLTVSVPVMVYARELGVSRERLIRALVLSNLVAIHQKTGIGRLSAYCGAVSAACGSGAGITYLHGGGYHAICKTITNTLANVSGILCDGAKPSCAAKIASAVDAAILAHCLAMESESFEAGDGIVKADVEDTIHSVGRIASEGMRQTDETILGIVIE